MSIQLNSDEFIPSQREEIRKAVDEILDDFMEPLVTYTIIDEIKSLAQAANMPKSFVDGVKFKRTGKNKGEVINTWGTEEIPLARFFNYGTSKHWIEPKNKKALAFGGGGTHAQSIYFQGSAPAGTKFSKGHYVSGVPKTLVMERGFNIGKVRLAQEAAVIIQRELNYNE